MPRHDTCIDTTNRVRPPSRLAILLAAVGAVTAGVSYAASDADAVPTITVRYGDRDLATDAGARKLYGRIRTAAAAVCPQPDIRDLAAAAASTACRREAIARAVVQMHSSRLAAVAATHSRQG